jgi:hypothetical protein
MQGKANALANSKTAKQQNSKTAKQPDSPIPLAVQWQVFAAHARHRTDTAAQL